MGSVIRVDFRSALRRGRQLIDMSFEEEARRERIELEAEAIAWLERHGERAYGLARRRVHAAWRQGNHEEADHWQAIRAHVARLTGRRIGPSPEKEEWR